MTRTRQQRLPGTLYDVGFSVFWANYPKKRAKDDAAKAWDELRPDDVTQQAIQTALGWQRLSMDWRKNGGAFVPHPATYLRHRRWLDEPAEPPALCALPVHEEWHTRVRTAQEAAFAKDKDEIRKAWAARYRSQGMSEAEIARRLGPKQE